MRVIIATGGEAISSSLFQIFVATHPGWRELAVTPVPGASNNSFKKYIYKYRYATNVTLHLKVMKL